MRGAALVLLLTLSACGIDGPPVPPSEVEEDRQQTGVTLSGSAEFGVSGRF
ncbi:hypothetical protein N9W17_01825 [Jannaschia sp.]|nr:hypothetical protein [Jannaschia sp.]